MIYLKYFVTILVSVFGFVLFIVAIISSECTPCYSTGVFHIFCNEPTTFCLTIPSALSALGSILILSKLLNKLFVKLPIFQTNRYNAESLIC